VAPRAASPLRRAPVGQRRQRLDRPEAHCSATPPPWSLSTEKMIHVVDPDRADQDQIDRYNIVQERWLHASGQAIA
jgi:hypothetical protein